MCDIQEYNYFIHLNDHLYKINCSKGMNFVKKCYFNIN